MKVTQWNVN